MFIIKSDKLFLTAIVQLIIMLKYCLIDFEFSMMR